MKWLISLIIFVMINSCVHHPEDICERSGIGVQSIAIKSHEDEKGYLDSFDIHCVKRVFKE